MNIIKLFSIMALVSTLCFSCGGQKTTGDAADDTGDAADLADTADSTPDQPDDTDDALDDPVPDPTPDPTPDPEPDTEPDVEPDPMEDGEDMVEDEVGGDAVDPCAPQEAEATGECEEELDGIKWDGEHCVPLGSGCECTGADCDALYETVAECVGARIGCYDVGCEPMEVADDMCIDCLITVFLGAFWNGRKCFSIMGCNCVGAGCEDAFASVEECEAVQAGCPGALCKATGGQWFTQEAGFCRFYCGVLGPEECLADTCRCEPGRTFEADVGCRDDMDCEAEEMCLATRGKWFPSSECICGFTCGRPNDCDACLDSCDCGPHRNFSPSTGCVADIMCEAADQQEVCEDTGGTWQESGASCGHFYCGIPNLVDPCVGPSCDCGRVGNFSEVDGCAYDDTCLMKEVGQDCWGSSPSSSCRAGLACCISGGIPGFRSCTDPCCKDHEICEDDGCYPPPP